MDNLELIENELLEDGIDLDFIYDRDMDIYWIHVSYRDKTHRKAFNFDRERAYAEYNSIAFSLVYDFDRYGFNTFVRNTHETV